MYPVLTKMVRTTTCGVGSIPKLRIPGTHSGDLHDPVYGVGRVTEIGWVRRNRAQRRGVRSRDDPAN